LTIYIVHNVPEINKVANTSVDNYPTRGMALIKIDKVNMLNYALYKQRRVKDLNYHAEKENNNSMVTNP